MSTPMTVTPGTVFKSSKTRFAPINPAAPVTRIFFSFKEIVCIFSLPFPAYAECIFYTSAPQDGLQASVTRRNRAVISRGRVTAEPMTTA